MSEWVDMSVIDTAFQIGFIATGVLEKPSLPNSVFPLHFPTGRNSLLNSAALDPGCGEFGFDPLPTGRIIRVAVRQCPDRMQVIRQQDKRRDLKRQLLPHFRDGLPQTAAGQVGRQNLRPAMSDHREKVHAALEC